MGTLTQRTRLRRHSPLRPRSRIRPRGRRARRLRAADRRQEEIVHSMQCVCGCDALTGEVSRAHLVPRNAESRRNEDWNNMPACWWLNRWLDQEPGGVDCKRELLEQAKKQGRRLEARDVQPLLQEWGYYEWRRRSGGG